jgi:hypothetical protein
MIDLGSEDEEVIVSKTMNKSTDDPLIECCIEVKIERDAELSIPTTLLHGCNKTAPLTIVRTAYDSTDR